MIKVKNAPDTDHLKAWEYSDYNSWIKFWESKRSKCPLLDTKKNLYKCAKCGHLLTWSDFHGAHIQKPPFDSRPDDIALYIYPICSKCNEERDETPFNIDEALLVPMPEKKIK